MTVARIQGMLRRMPEDVLKAYVQQCQELEEKGWMVPAPVDKPAKNYIANFALKTNSLTTPVRLLFNCDQKTSNGRSVNDFQHCGRKLQNDLPNCITKFRYKKIAITGDIST